MSNFPPTAFQLSANHVELTEREFALFRDLISERSGISLRDTKCYMLAARLQRRLTALGLANFQAYYEFLIHRDETGMEWRELINRVTTNKTSFFRESHHFEFLAQLFENQIRSTSAPRPFRIWSAACSSGEEPFSIAMTLRDALYRISSKREIEIVATDIDTTILETARSSIYSEADLEPVPIPFRQRFFLRGRGSQVGRYRIKPEIRDLVHFERLNLVDAAWDLRGSFDVIFCRNALIYFERATQDRILRRMTGLLRPRSHLIVGHSEQLFWMSDLLEPIGTTTYRVKDGA